MAGLALLHFHGFIEIRSLDAISSNEVDSATGERAVLARLCYTGIYNDPNDLSMILVLSTIACLFFADNSPGQLARGLWLAPPVMFLYALKLTSSRGGLINLALSLLILCQARLGKKTLGIAILALPLMIVVFGGRQTKIDASDSGDTAQARIQLWSAGFEMFQHYPIFGVGMNEYAERAGLVAHNTYVNSYAELGFVGGTLFVGAFYAALSGLSRLGNKTVVISDPFLVKLRPYVWAITWSFCIGITSLSRAYTVPTYVVLGIAGSYLQIAEPRSSIPPLKFDSSFVQRMLGVGVACVVVFYLFVRIMVRF